MNLQAGLVRREEMIELQRTLSEHVNLNDALKKRNIDLEDEVKDLEDWQEELTQNAIEAEKDFNVKQRLWTEENAILQSRNRSLAEERDRKDQEVSDVKDQLNLSQQATQQAEAHLNEITMAYRGLKAVHDGLPERYEAARQAAKEAVDSAASQDATIATLQAQLAAKQAELDALSGSAEGRTASLQKALDAERQQREQSMSEAQHRWEERLARVQGDKVMAEAFAEEMKGQFEELQGRFGLMEGDVHTRDERATDQIKKLEADIAQQLAQVAQIQAALKESQDQVVQQKAIATQAEAAMKMAQAEAAAAAENVKLEKETGDQCTEEAMRAMTAVDVQLQQAKEKDAELVRRAKQVEAKEALVKQELEQREQALEGQLKAAEDAAAARVSSAEQQVSAAKAELEQEFQARNKASTELQAKHEAALAEITQRESELEEQLIVLKRALGGAAANGEGGKENSMDLDGVDTNRGVATISARILALQEKDAELQKTVRELEERSEKLRGEVENAAAAREELAKLRKDVRDAASQKGDLENLIRDLQKEELSLRTKITGAKMASPNAPVGNSGSKHDSAPVAFGSPRAASIPFGSPAMPAAHATAVVSPQNGATDGAGRQQEGMTLSPCDGAVKSNNSATPSKADQSQNPGVSPPSKGLFGGLLSRATGMFGTPTRPQSGGTPALLADDTAGRIESGDGQGRRTEVELAPPRWQQTANTPRFGDARTSTNASAKRRQQPLQTGAAVPGDGVGATVRSAKVSPEGTARLAASAKAAAEAAAVTPPSTSGADVAADAAAAAAEAVGPSTKRGAGSGTGSGGGSGTKRGTGTAATGAAAGTSALPKRPLSGSKRRRGVEESNAAEQAEANGADADAAVNEGDGAAADNDPDTSPQRTRKLDPVAGSTAAAGTGTGTGRTTTRTAKTGIARAPAPATGTAAQNADAKKADTAVDVARKRVAEKTKKEAAAAKPVAAAASGRSSQRIAASSAAATPVGGTDGGGSSQQHQQVTPPKISAGAAATRAGSATQERRPKRAAGTAGDDTKSGTTSGVSKSVLSGAGARRAAGPAAKKRAVAQDGNGAGTSAAAAGGTRGADVGAAAGARGGREPITIETSPEPDAAAENGDADGHGDDADPSTPHGMSARVHHLVEEAAAYTGYSPAELVNDDGQPLSARAVRAASRAHSQSTMTPGRGVEDGEEVDGGAGRVATPQPSGGKGKSRSRRVVPRTRGRSLQDIVEDEAEHSAGEDGAE